MSASSSRGFVNSQLMTSLASSNYMKNVGVLEFAKSSLIENIKKTPNKISMKSQEEYQEEILAMKKQNRELVSEISLLKFKVRHSAYEIAKKQKIINDFSNVKQCKQNELYSTNVINNLKRKVAKIEEKYREKQEVLTMLQKDIKSTNVAEMKITIETLKNELQRLKQAAILGKQSINIKSSDNAFKRNKKSNVSSNDATRIKELSSTILQISSDKNRLMLENKSLKIDLQKSLEMQEKLRKKHEITSEKIEQCASLPELYESLPGNVNFTSTNINHKMLEKYHENEKELKSELKRLAKQIDKIKEERNFYRDKCFVMETTQADQNSKKESRTVSMSCAQTKVIVETTENSQRKLKTFPDEDAVNFMQSLIRNHKARCDNLYLSNDAGTLSKLDGAGEAVNLIQSIARNIKLIDL